MEYARSVPSSNNLSIKVVAIAAGEAHTLLLTGDGRVNSWGRGTLGRLGVGSEQDQHFPVQVKFGSEDSVRIVGIAAGAYHSLALAGDGSVWCWGYNLYGQLGICGEDSQSLKHANGDYSVVPCLLSKFLELHPPDPDSSTVLSEAEGKSSLKILSVKAGGMMSLSIDNLGALWMWGNCPHQSKEGGFSVVSNFTPTPVWHFHGHTVVKVACGNEHVIALVSAGESYNGEEDDLVCYSWGNNSHGQLGLGDKENRSHPQVVKTFDHKSSWKVYEVACGAFHTALLTYKKRPNDTLESVCWTFGLGDNGQLGHGTTQSTSLPEPVKELPQHVDLISIDCGLFHTCVVSSSGDVWSWGMEKGLGLYPDARVAGENSGDALSPLLMPCNPYQPKFPEPVQVACGAAHTIIVAHEGYKLWSWGRGRSGVLGNGKAMDCYTPTIVVWPPLVEDFKQEEPSSSRKHDKTKEKETEGVTETNEVNELKLLKTKLSIVKRYASILHEFIFGKPLDEQDIAVSLQNSGAFDIAKEWENMLEDADYTELVKMEMLYRNMHAGVKDRLVKRRIKEITKESLKPSEVEN